MCYADAVLAYADPDKQICVLPNSVFRYSRRQAFDTMQFIAAVNPVVVLRLIAVAEAAKYLYDHSGSGKGAQDLGDALTALSSASTAKG